ncbi:MAG: beta-N-acetylhexosaminidase [Bdellovibrionales bacterium]|nr:beta-N-acetylhexosaminidase [Bdellovibrionales bacterium]
MKNHETRNAGQFFMVGVSSTTLSNEEKSFLQEVQPKGVIYFRRNVESPSQLIDLTRQVQACVSHPLIVGIDQEGGRVARLSHPFTIFPGNEELAEQYENSKDLSWILKKAKWQARELKAVGINCNFAPVADILTNPSNPIMQKRTFGASPEQAAFLVKKTIEVFQKEKILSCAKHFPGHGDTLVDSHLELPKVQTDKKTLFSRELIPFVSAVAASVPMIMTAHIRYEKIDSKNPATLSPFFLTEVLRKKMKFQGCIVSDDLEMKAIEHHYDLPQAAKLAISAGCNLLLVCEDQQKAYRCFEEVSRCLSGKEFQKRLLENQNMYKKWHRKYVFSKLLRKRKKWGWTSHRFYVKN